ncbi:MAG: energy transducer TonB [Pseudomonadota bacterium]
MSTLAFSTSPAMGDARAALGKLRAKCAPMATVVLAHAILFYAIYSGMLTRMVDAALPQAVLVTFVTPVEPPPPAAPKVVPMAQVTPPPMPFVPAPQVQVIVQQSNAISVTHTPPPVAPAPVQAVAAPAPAPVATGPKTITSGVDFIQAPQPVYPQMSRKMGEQGKVVLRILVNEKGLPSQVSVQSSSGSTRLDEAGRQAVLRALFKPYIEDGRAVSVYVIFPLNFELT